MIYSISKEIIALETWNVNKWMIDKSSSLLQAILQYKYCFSIIELELTASVRLSI